MVLFINDFKDITEKYYSAQVNSEDFSNADTVSKINKWVEQATNGQIKKIIDSIDEYDTAVLINSLYFKGRWQHEFSLNNTRKEEFTLSNGKKISIDNMKRRGYVSYFL
ncbi:serpin family protein [Clostridium sp. DJ247]|uniref:serpin family protein n=1 Tax=Clostridium sp. DJ247 TaxID=2726188 RepID=UPI0016242622|nr:serpin family protein [Clostridium sp. DJ247]MBC2578855.1 serpin family protein [Clostridium sp. DJ247]